MDIKNAINSSSFEVSPLETATEFSTLPVVLFLQQIVKHLEYQSGLVESEAGAHPDPQIRAFNKGLLAYLQSGSDFDFLVALARIYRQQSARQASDSGHFVDLFARSIQFLHRNRGNSDYVSFTADDWATYFETTIAHELDELEKILTERQVATHVISRYRGLAAALVVRQQKTKQPARVVDIGCSLNVGLPMSLFPQMLLNMVQPALVDHTPDESIQRALQTPQIVCEHAIGIDLHLPDLHWVAACAYFSQYDLHMQQLNTAIEFLRTVQVPVFSSVGDVTNPQLVSVVKSPNGNSPDIMHAAMCLYQLSDIKREQALRNIATALAKDGLFIELTFIDPHNWFRPWNVHTTVQVKQKNGTLSQPLQWLVWENSRCGQVKVGSDFKQVRKLLGLERHWYQALFASL
jgi:hypothetical protein